MNRSCTKIATKQQDSKLLRLILAEDNEMGLMGSGGYRIRELPRTEQAVHIRLNPMDCGPAPSHHIFIKGGVIWVTYMKSWVMKLLADKRIAFSTKSVINPRFITDKITELQAV